MTGEIQHLSLLFLSYVINKWPNGVFPIKMQPNKYKANTRDISREVSCAMEYDKTCVIVNGAENYYCIPHIIQHIAFL